MKRVLLMCVAAALVVGCHKNQAGGNGNGDDDIKPDFTTVPAAENVNTEITGYVTNDKNRLLTGPNYFHFLNGDYSSGAFTLMGNGMFYTLPRLTDKYRTRTMVTAGGGWDYLNTEQTFALTSSFKNYVRIKVLNRINIGSVTNNVGGSFSITGGGTITFGINTFYRTGTLYYPGYFGPEIKSRIYSTYLDPEDKEFAMRLPSYLAGDDDQKRWFLKSYGAITMKMNEDDYSGENIDFYSGRQAEIKLPIPPAMQSGAPDSVNAWQLFSGAWIKSGWAKKQGNFYTARIGKVTAWTFAEPVKGVYLNARLRSDSNATITNTAIRIKSNTRVIAESRTDADGNAIFFVPTRESLVAEIIPEERINSTKTYSLNIGSITSGSTIDLTMPGNTQDFSSVMANVSDCTGKPVNNGMAKISFDAINTEYFIPVKNGRLATAMWIYGTNNGIRVHMIDSATNAQGEQIRLTLFNGGLQRFNLYNCQGSSSLYCNYYIDNKSYELTDEANSSAVFMTASKTSQYSPLTIKTSGNKLGFNLTVDGIYTAMLTSGRITDLVVNGVSCNYDPSTDPVISITRYDTAPNGYMEGCVIFYYRDNENVRHRLSGNFKVKKMF